MGQLVSRIGICVAVVVIPSVIRYIRADCDPRTRRCRVPQGYYKGKVAWITGATSGIGASLAEQLAQYGALLILSGRNGQVLETTAERLRVYTRVEILPFDLEWPYEDIEKVARKALELYGTLDVLCNNAGISTRVRAANLEMKGVERVLKVDFLSQVAITRICLPTLVQRKGTIVNTSSIASMVPVPLRSSYTAAKAALDNYFTALQYENHDIHVLSARPGSTRTNVAVNAIIGDGKVFGKTDPNIQNGLHPDRVADRMLAAAACKIPTAWIAKPSELTVVRIAYYFPALWRMLAFKSAKRYEAGIVNQSHQSHS